MPIIHTSVLSCSWNNRKYVRKLVPSANRDIYNFNIINCFQTNLDAGKVFDNVPCSVCYVSERRAKLMIPARKTCPGGWKREYGGYLMTSHRFKHRTTFACMDEAPETIAPSGGKDGVE